MDAADRCRQRHQRLAAFLNYGAVPSGGAIAVENAAHNYISTAAAYAFLSYGPDGHGGYLKNGTQFFMGSDNADELTNCHCTGTAANNGLYAATYVQQDPTQTSPTDPLSVFDDIVPLQGTLAECRTPMIPTAPPACP